MTPAVTPAEQVERVRACLANMGAQADTVARRLPQWGAVAERCGDETDLDIGAFIAAASPDLLLRLTDYAEGVLDRHRHRIRNGENWCGAHSHWPCPEITAVINAWLPWPS